MPQTTVLDPDANPADRTPDPGSSDELLLARVRPPDWKNPDPVDRYDLVVIGAGTGGLVSVAIGAALGARVALVERNRMGGDCLNFGCVPSKGVLRAARSWAEARASAERFGGPEVSGPGDFGAAIARMRAIRAGISAVDSAERFASLGVDVFMGEARFDSESSLVLDDGDRLRFRRAILATGARAAVPPIPGLESVDYHTNETIFDLAELPSRLIVLGAVGASQSIIVCAPRIPASSPSVTWPRSTSSRTPPTPRPGWRSATRSSSAAASPAIWTSPGRPTPAPSLPGWASPGPRRRRRGWRSRPSPFRSRRWIVPASTETRRASCACI